jgi:di/tricarboxylate transporter
LPVPKEGDLDIIRFVHDMFASVTAHVTALIPVLLAVGSAVLKMNMSQLACCSVSNMERSTVL